MFHNRNGEGRTQGDDMGGGSGRIFDDGKVDINGKSPWWVVAIYKLGVPAAVMAFLVYFLVSTVNKQLTEIARQVQVHQNQSTLDQQQIRFYLRAICVHTAASDRDRTDCFAGDPDK